MENELKRANWTRKAERWEAEVINDPAVLTAIKAGLETNRLPVYLSAEAFPCSKFSGTDAESRPRFFVAKRPNGRSFLVDTQGYDYHRYIAQLPEGL
jgi:hypothetical protein